MKTKKWPSNEGKTLEPWFDSECKSIKNELKSLGNKLEKSPGNETLRKTLRESKKSFKKIDHNF